MHNPVASPRTATYLEADEQTPRAASSPPVEVGVADIRTKLHVQTWDCDMTTAARAAAVLSIAWPASVGAASGTHTRVLCYGPADWLIVSREPTGPLVQRLEAVFGGSTFIVTDQSQGLGTLEIRGPRSRELLSKACGLDLHPRGFAVGSCARTRLASVPVIVDAPEGDLFTCAVARSYLSYLQRWLSDAALEFPGQER
jgi:sarcosine oxidase, subunit gamma